MNPEPSIPLGIVQHALRVNLPFIAMASIVFAAAVAAIVIARLRSRHGLLFWLGIFALVYAVRLFLENDLIRRASGMDYQFFELAVRILTYLIPIPFALFLHEYFGWGWKKSILLWLWIEAVYAPLGIATTLFDWHSRAAFDLNNFWIIFGTLLIVLHLLLHHGVTSAAPKTAIIVACALVILNNLHFRPRGINLEPFGFVMLLCALGYTATEAAIAKEHKLTEVEYELAMARRIQASILPAAPPELPSLRIATRYQPMTEVAGDFYDFLRPREDSITILVADVSGHGVPAALVASMLKIGFAAQIEHASDPARILDGLNTMLRPILADQYVTAACAVVDLAAKLVTYSAAGHPPALLLRRRSDRVAQLAENGLFIGPFPQAAYSNISLSFETGDKLLLYTDGIIEATISGGEQFGIERLTNFLLRTQELQASDFIDHLFAQISSKVQEDDLTIVLAEFE